MACRSLKSPELGGRRGGARWLSDAAPPQLAGLGDEFAQRGEHCLLLVPSVLAPNENNCLINPAHPDYKRIVVREVEPLSYDPRMFRKQRSHRWQ
ncbi:MAG TPA: RES family NAD+ phosphorylase [Candidatus Sulfotelmatobacter sp.]|nr:RES family NAD+ phosphorylase [Candidatus Sulfotelmatobacter sp.]